MSAATYQSTALRNAQSKCILQSLLWLHSLSSHWTVGLGSVGFIPLRLCFPDFPGLSDFPADILQLPPLESPVYRCGCPPICDDIVSLSLQLLQSSSLLLLSPHSSTLSRAIKVIADSLQLLSVDSCPAHLSTPHLLRTVVVLHSQAVKSYSVGRSSLRLSSLSSTLDLYVTPHILLRILTPVTNSILAFQLYGVGAAATAATIATTPETSPVRPQRRFRSRITYHCPLRQASEDFLPK